MTQRLYIIPVVKIPIPGGGTYNVPKYLPHRLNPPLAGLEGIKGAWVTYLLEDVGIAMVDTSDAQNALLVAQPDVLLIPPLDNAIPNATARNRVRSILEAASIPGNWVNVGMTYRSVLRVVLGLIKFHRRLVGLTQARLFDGSINLDMTVSQIPPAKRDRLQEVADYFGLDYSWVIGTTTIRELLKGMGDQFANHPFIIGGFTI